MFARRCPQNFPQRIPKWRLPRRRLPAAGTCKSRWRACVTAAPLTPGARRSPGLSGTPRNCDRPGTLRPGIPRPCVMPCVTMPRRSRLPSSRCWAMCWRLRGASGGIPVNSMKDVTRPAAPDHREVLIAGPQVRRMLRQLGWRGAGQPVRSVSEAMAVCMSAALLTGMRAGELCALARRDLHEDHAVLHTSKTGKGRHVPLTATRAVP
ncbi:hypothetical protein D8B29_13460 [Verminephrobacter eiseniae]|nr:hypothetical protein [Verminephrobacter eiseniae]MCW5305450.1 hypothetical protein [Verminephrobacter eiseniae]MCW8180574.1 hypothetical protein [Verminephrobacter eiseniae]MCW8189405.1 hypothetical protein [Verminephrobacter eiseniae]